jgi:methionine-rich copper-binding protein CopC
VKRAGLIAALAVAALTLPGSAFAHAALLRTVPQASGTVNVAPRSCR